MAGDLIILSKLAIGKIKPSAWRSTKQLPKPSTIPIHYSSACKGTVSQYGCLAPEQLSYFHSSSPASKEPELKLAQHLRQQLRPISSLPFEIAMPVPTHNLKPQKDKFLVVCWKDQDTKSWKKPCIKKQQGEIGPHAGKKKHSRRLKRGLISPHPSLLMLGTWTWPCQTHPNTVASLFHFGNCLAVPAKPHWLNCKEQERQGDSSLLLQKSQQDWEGELETRQTDGITTVSRRGQRQLLFTRTPVPGHTLKAGNCQARGMASFGDSCLGSSPWTETSTVSAIDGGRAQMEIGANCYQGLKGNSVYSRNSPHPRPSPLIDRGKWEEPPPAPIHNEKYQPFSRCVFNFEVKRFGFPVTDAGHWLGASHTWSRHGIPVPPRSPSCSKKNALPAPLLAKGMSSSSTLLQDHLCWPSIISSLFYPLA